MKIKHPRLAGFITVILTIIAFVISPAMAQNKPYKVGVLLSITGYISFAGTAVRDAVTLEVDKINEGGGINGRKIELIIEDDASDTSKSVASFNKLAKIHKVDAIIGPILARSASIIGKDADKEKVPTLIICPSDIDYRAAGYKYTFNIPQNDPIVAEAIVDYVVKNDLKKIVTFTNITDPMWVSISETIKRMGEKRGLKVYDAPEGYESNAMDMTPQLIKLRKLIEQEGIEAIVVSSHGMNGGVIAKNMQTLGMKIPVIGSHAYGFEFTLGVGGDALEGTVFPSGKIIKAEELPGSDPQQPILVDFIKRYSTKYGNRPDQFASHGWDAVHMLAEAFKVSNGDNAKTRDALEHITKFVGLTGVFTYKTGDHDGLGTDSLVWYKIQGGKFQLLK
jgi:branched-chain amino acid transport system substrate-binding protein